MRRDAEPRARPQVVETELNIGALERDVEYSYLPEQNAIFFAEDQVPPSEYYIVATYEVSAVPNTADTDGATE